MKYFIDNISDEEWEQNRTAYWDRFRAQKCKMDRKTYEVLSSKYLHDSEITSLALEAVKQSKKNQHRVLLSIHNDCFSGTLIHYNVTKFECSFYNELKYRYIYEYLYGEVLYENVRWTHNVTISNNNQLSIDCSKIVYVDNADSSFQANL